jgi:hypothetical protein
MPDRRLLQVDADVLLRALTARDEGLLGTYLDLSTGELLRLVDPAIAGRDNESVEGRLDEEPERYARVPVYNREYRLMSAFVDTVRDDDLARLLDMALSGREAFRRFEAVLRGWPSDLARWRAFREAALARWAAAWLRSIGIEPAWSRSDVPDEIQTVPVLLLLAAGAHEPSDDGRLVRVLEAGSHAEARALFTRAVRQLCELRAEPFRARALRGSTRFAVDGIELERDGRVVRLRLPMLNRGVPGDRT